MACRQLDRISRTAQRSNLAQLCGHPCPPLNMDCKESEEALVARCPPGMSCICEGSTPLISDALRWQNPQPCGSGGVSLGGQGVGRSPDPAFLCPPAAVSLGHNPPPCSDPSFTWRLQAEIV